MKCSKVKKKLSAYLDGETSAEEQQIISEHIKSCASCQHDLKVLRTVSRTLDEVDDVEVTPYFRVHLRTRLREENTGERRPFFLLEWIRKITIPVAAAALFLFSIIAGGRFGGIIYQLTIAETYEQGAEIDYIAGISGLDDASDVSFSEIYNELYTGGTE